MEYNVVIHCFVIGNFNLYVNAKSQWEYFHGQTLAQMHYNFILC